MITEWVEPLAHGLDLEKIKSSLKRKKTWLALGMQGLFAGLLWKIGYTIFHFCRCRYYERIFREMFEDEDRTAFEMGYYEPLFEHLYSEEDNDPAYFNPSHSYMAVDTHWREPEGLVIES